MGFIKWYLTFTTHVLVHKHGDTSTGATVTFLHENLTIYSVHSYRDNSFTDFPPFSNNLKPPGTPFLI